MLQLSNLKRVMSKMALIAIITMFFAGIAYAQTEPKTELSGSCKQEKQLCKAQKKERKIQSKANKQLCKEICKENKRQK